MGSFDINENLKYLEQFTDGDCTVSNPEMCGFEEPICSHCLACDVINKAAADIASVTARIEKQESNNHSE